MPKLSSREPCFVSILTVKVSSFQSCVDMMRYDSCCPATEEDAAKLIRLTGQTATQADHIIKFKRFARNSQPATFTRWRSFNCFVLDERAPGEDPFDINTILPAGTVLA
jgi:hypothetical protein